MCRIFTDTYRAWIEDRRGQVAPASADRYEYMLERFVLPEFGDKDVNEITPADFGEYISSLMDTDKYGDRALGSSTAETLIGLANSIIEFAKRDETTDVSFIPKDSSPKKHYDPLTPDEIACVVSCARFNRNPETLGVLLSLYTGISTGELCALSWDDVDLDRREIYIHSTLYRLRDHESGSKKTRLAVMEVRHSSIRSVVYPEELAAGMSTYYKEGTVFLTCERDKYIEQRTFCNHLEKMFSSYGIKGLTLKRVANTYKEGLADIRYLRDPLFHPEASASIDAGLDEKWLIKEMEHDLAPLRGILGLTGEDMGGLLGMSVEDYLAIEAGEERLDWNGFLSLLFFFKYNSKTEGVVEALGLYPDALKERLTI